MNKKVVVKDKRFLKMIGLYSLFFLIISFVMVFIFLKYDRLFIWNNSDGVKQHIVTLRYFRELLLDFFKTGNFNTFTWNIASGMDMYGNLVYYIMGDFFSYLVIFFKVESLNKLYSVLVLFRMYLAGVSFLSYTNYKKMKVVPSVIGAIYYTFSTFMLFSAVRHPYFTNALILFPLVILGFEKLVMENKKILYILAVFLTFISNFYFAYMIVFIIAIYGLVFIFYNYKKNGLKKIVQILIRVILCSLVSLLLAGIQLLPVIFDFLDSERTGYLAVEPYTISYYRNLIKGLLSLESPGFWVYNGIGQSIIFLSLPVFWSRKKENLPLFITFLILLLPLVFSKIASFFCGFGFPNNRWTFVFSFILAYSVSSLFNSCKPIMRKEFIYIGVFISFFLLCNIFFDEVLDKYLMIQFLILGLWILVFFKRDYLENREMDSFFKLGLCIIGVIVSIKYFYDIDGLNYSREFLKQGDLNNYINTSYKTIDDFSQAIDYIKKDNTFYRISKYPYNYENVSLIKDYNSIGHFYSITPTVYSDLNFDLANVDYRISMGFGEFDYRSRITTLMGEKYFINGSEINKSMYGYDKDNGYKGPSTIYENTCSLPFGILYTSYISEENYNKMSPLEKESSLLKQTIYNENINLTKLHEGDTHFDIREIDYELEDFLGILEENKIYVKDDNNKITLKIPDLENSELYVYFSNLEYHPFSKDELIEEELVDEKDLNKIEKVRKKYKWYEPSYDYDLIINYNSFLKKKNINDYRTSPYFVNTKDFLFNLGYSVKHSGRIDLALSKKGYYTYDAIKVYAVGFENYEEEINNLRKSNFEVKEYGNSYLVGEVNASQDGILQFQTLFTKGMHVYVDDEEVVTFKSNKYFLGINIDSGHHKIVLKYQNPYLFYGGLMSFSGLILLIMILWLEYKKVRVE